MRDDAVSVGEKLNYDKDGKIKQENGWNWSNTIKQ